MQNSIHLSEFQTSSRTSTLSVTRYYSKFSESTFLHILSNHLAKVFHEDQLISVVYQRTKSDKPSFLFKAHITKKTILSFDRVDLAKLRHDRETYKFKVDSKGDWLESHGYKQDSTPELCVLTLKKCEDQQEGSNCE